MSPWFKVLDFWCNKKVPIGSGLTIPFLIGSDFIINGELKTVSDFIDEINSQKNDVFSIRYCTVIGEYIIQLNDSWDKSLNYYPKIGNLFITDKELIELNNSGKMIDSLTNEYSDPIKKENFSINNGSWEKLNDTEIEMIKTCYNNGYK